MLCGDGGVLLRHSGLLLSDQRRELAHLSREVVEVGGRTSVFHDLYNVRHTKKFPHTGKIFFRRRRLRVAIAGDAVRSTVQCLPGSLPIRSSAVRWPRQYRHCRALVAIRRFRPPTACTQSLGRRPTNASTFTLLRRRLKNKKRWPDSTRLPQLAFYDADQTRKTLPQIGWLGISEDARRAGEHQHGDDPP